MTRWLTGGEANAPGPGKRPLSSMSPTILLKDGKPFLVTGSPGGSRIITAVLQIILNVIDHRMTLADAMSAPRLHHQSLPDSIQLEPGGFESAVIARLREMGHFVYEQRGIASAASIMRVKGGYDGLDDPRSRGGAAAGF